MIYLYEDSIFADLFPAPSLGKNYIPLYTQILHVYGFAYLYILGDVDGKTTGNMPIDWVFGTGIITSQCCFMDSSKKHEPWRNLSGLILLSSAVTL